LRKSLRTNFNDALMVNVSLVLDPNIPETGEQLERSSFGPEDCCFRYCDTTESVAQLLKRAATRQTSLLAHQKEVQHGVCSAACSQPSPLQAYSSSNAATTPDEAARQCSHTNKESCASSQHPTSSLSPPSPPNHKSFRSKKMTMQLQSSSQPRKNNEVVVNSSGQKFSDGRRVQDSAVDSAANRGVRTSSSFHIHSWTRHLRRAGGAIVAPLLASDRNIFSDNRLPVLRRRWWSSIFTKIFAIAELIAALLPYVLLFLLVQKRAVEGYL